MKIRLKTEFWDEEDPEIWKRNYEKIVFIFTIGAMINGIAAIFTGSIILLILNAVYFSVGTLITITYNKRSRKNGGTAKTE